jgi:hypothetical protein
MAGDTRDERSMEATTSRRARRRSDALRLRDNNSERGLKCSPRWSYETARVFICTYSPRGVFLPRRRIPGAGLEPARPCGQGILSPTRLPFRHPGARRIPARASHDAMCSAFAKAEMLGTNVRILATPGERDLVAGARHFERDDAAVFSSRSNQLQAGNGTRTRDPNLGKVVLYQLSYSRSIDEVIAPPLPRQVTHSD